MPWREPGGGLRQALREALPPAIDRTCRPLAVPPAVGAACRLLAPGPRRRLIAAMSGTEG